MPMTRNTGSAAEKASASPPTRMVSVALFAPTPPPETGASSARMPRAAAAVRIFSASAGEEVVMSTSNALGRAAATMPSAPR